MLRCKWWAICRSTWPPTCCSSGCGRCRHVPARFGFGRVPLTLMFQSEVANRIVAVPGTRTYGRLSVMTQQSCDAQAVTTVLGKQFVPPPAVDATVVSITPRIQATPLQSLDALEWLLRELFSLRRKMLRSVAVPLEQHFNKPLLSLAEINPALRPQELTVSEWCRLADICHELEPTLAVSTPTVRTNAAERKRVHRKKQSEKDRR
eukprot:TRINITY_DN2515_c0_g1_i1.p2 TRINITY_DN2515_c0_g1~~TRINITY_DN2515_c0_g1_i1.p2  ORF type:complete len:206 (-),score=65.57 TRINITY_DN2515_c0_g1_i1:3-620(-)